ncbi:MAG TPA: LamG-like jellyroll fold domain-containing protein [Propionibacteriaceae bacterium]|nr:LamG-like jellyroll fold domain-containing protein [Propionibacteriaceae bacterium]
MHAFLSPTSIPSTKRARCVLAFLLMLAMLLANGAVIVAAADPGPIAARPSSGVTADVLPTVQIDGVVWDQEVVGDTVYAGGEFTNARPAGAAPGTNLTPRSNLLAYNLRTGALITSFAPTLNGKVKALSSSPDRKTLYVGGSFTLVNNVARYRIAAFNTATGAVTTFSPAPNATVNSISATDTAVYAGGAFTKVGGADRGRLAAFSTTGALTAWAPTVDSSVNAVLVTPDRSRVLAAGSFANANNAPTTGLASFDSTNAALLPFAANTVVRNYGTQAAMLSLSTDGKTVYSGGYWFGGPTGNFEGLLAADPITGAIKWLADCHGDTYDGSAVNGVVYAVSHHHHCTNMGGFPDTGPPRSRWQRANAFTVAATGTLAHNNQCCYADFYGKPSPSIVNWFPDVVAGTYTGQNQGGWTTTGTSEYLLQGGEFTSVNGTKQQGLVRFAVPSLAPRKQGPRASGAAFNPGLLATSKGSVKVSWQANWDRDDQNLTYRLTRLDRSGTPLFTGQQTSTFWNRPSMSFTDTTVATGQTYRYKVSATDPDGNVAFSNSVSITVPATIHPYVTAVSADGASDYWRMNGAGPTYPSVTGPSSLYANAGVSASSLGALVRNGDGAAGFDGATGAAASSNVSASPDTFTAEAWFKTTTTTGGKILGFGSAASGLSGTYDRHLYLENSGQLAFGVYSGRTSVVRSTAIYNDGGWHHAVAQLSPAGMALYVDGVKVAANPTVTAGPRYNGYWRVGSDNLNNWPNRPTSVSFKGAIDEVAIYPSALTAAQVKAHHTAAVEPVDADPVATFASSCADAVCTFDGTGSTDADGTEASYDWDFGDGSGGTGATPTHTYAGTGSYPVTLTVTAENNATTSVTKKVVLALGAFAADAFDRTASSWGTADQGGAWTHSGTTYSTNGSAGLVRLATAGTGATATLGSVSQRDVNAVADVTVDTAATGTGTYTTFLTRRVGTSDYRFTYRQMTNGAIRLTLAKAVAGTTTSLRDVNLTGLTYQAGDTIRVRFTVSGSGTSTLTGKAWHAGTAEPASAQITATDSTASLQTAGAFGIFSYLGSTVTAVPVTVGIDDLLLT